MAKLNMLQKADIQKEMFELLLDITTGNGGTLFPGDKELIRANPVGFARVAISLLLAEEKVEQATALLAVLLAQYFEQEDLDSEEDRLEPAWFYLHRTGWKYADLHWREAENIIQEWDDHAIIPLNVKFA